MSAYLISGPSGSGKSTAGKELQQRGFRVIDTDFSYRLSGWFNNETSELVTDIPPQPYTKEWVAAHSWLWDAEKMNDLLASVGDEPVFFCGGAYNERDFYASFTKRFGLCVDGKTLTERLQEREPQRWTNDSAELQRGLEWNAKFKEICIANGAVVIDSSVAPELVADAILAQI